MTHQQDQQNLELYVKIGKLQACTISESSLGSKHALTQSDAAGAARCAFFQLSLSLTLSLSLSLSLSLRLWTQLFGTESTSNVRVSNMSTYGIQADPPYSSDSSSKVQVFNYDS